MIRVYEKNAIPCSIQQIRHFSFPWFNLNRDGIGGYFGKLLANCIFLNVLYCKTSRVTLDPAARNHIWHSFSCWPIHCELYLKGRRSCVCLTRVSVLTAISETYVFDSTNQSKRSKWFEDCSSESFRENTEIFQEAPEPIKKKNGKWSYINNMPVKWHGTSWKLFPLIGKIIICPT